MKRLLSLAAVVLSVVISSTAFASPRSIPRPNHAAKITRTPVNLKKFPKNTKVKAASKKPAGHVDLKRVQRRLPRVVKH